MICKQNILRQVEICLRLRIEFLEVNQALTNHTMARKHQVFLITHNIYKEMRNWLRSYDPKKYKPLRLQLDVESKVAYEFSEMETFFGLEDTTVLVYHHQWLYGATALGVVYDALNFGRHVPGERNILHPEHYKFNGIKNLSKFNMFLECTKSLLSLRNNSEVIKKIGGRGGFERFALLNLDKPEVRHQFDSHPNDDGISIVDIIRKKYCFIDLPNSQTKHEKKYTPLSALEYYDCYYKTKKEDLDEKTKQDRTEIEIKALLDGNIKRTNEVKKLFKHFKVFSKAELTKIFPQMEEKLQG